MPGSAEGSRPFGVFDHFGRGEIQNDVILTTIANESTWSGDSSDPRATFDFEGKADDGDIVGSLDLDHNRCPVFSYEDLYDPIRWGSILGQVFPFRFPRWIREQCPGGALIFAYLDWFKEGHEPWTSLETSPIAGRGARGMIDFPDETEHALADRPLGRAPDIDGNAVAGDPDIGAYEIQV